MNENPAFDSIGQSSRLAIGVALFVVVASTIALIFGGSAMAPAVTAHAPMAAGTTDRAGTPAIEPRPSPLVHPTNSSSSPPWWYCPGGTAQQSSSSSQRFDLCTWVFNRSSTLTLGYYANVTQLASGNVSGNYSWSFAFGDGGTATYTSLTNLTGSYLHSYTANGTYSFFASVTDSSGSLNTTISVNVTLVIGAMSIALSSYETASGNGSTTTAFNCAISGGASPYNFQYAFGDGTYYLNNSSASTGSCATQHTYGPVTSATTYSVSVRAWDGAGHNATATLSVTPSYNYNRSSGGGSGGSVCGGSLGSGHNATAGSSTIHYLSNGSTQAWYLYAWAPHLNLTWNATLSIGNSSASVAMGGTASTTVSAACVSVNWGDGTFVGNRTIAAAGATALSYSHTFNRSGFFNVNVTISNGSVGAVANFSFRLNLSGSTGGSSGGNNSSSGSRVSQLIGSTWYDVWSVEVWVPGVYVNTTATLSIGNSSAIMIVNRSAVATVNGWSLVTDLPPVSIGTWNGSSGTYRAPGVYGHYYTNGTYAAVETLSQGGNRASGNFTFVLNFTGSTNSSNGTYPTSVSVTVGAAPVTGGAPLTVTLSAFISGGMAPFVVVWSLPGSSTPNSTGLMVTTTYNLSGWYPATAFVYNTTSTFGTVLVGYGSVWLYATGNTSGGGGSGGGNGSGNHSGDTPIPGAHAAGTIPSTGMSLTLSLLVAVALGGVAGGAAGFTLGQLRGPGRRPPVGPTNDQRGPHT